MSISTFGGVSPTSVTSSSRIIGEAIQVPIGFSTPGYVDAGAQFDSTVYPQLAAIFPPTFQADLWKKSNLPSMNATLTNSSLTVAKFFTLSGNAYMITTTGALYGTTGGTLSTMAFIKQLPKPNGVTTLSYVQVANGVVFVIWNATNIHLYADATFTNPTTTSISASNTPTLIKYLNGNYWATLGALSNVVYKSVDGITWSTVTLATGASLIVTGFEYAAGLYVFHTSSTAASNYCTSPDGVTWTVRSGPTVGGNGLKWTGSVFVWSPYNSTVSLYTSPDGITWTARAHNFGATTLVPFVDVLSSGTVVAAFPGQYISTSVDGGITWVNKSSFISNAGPGYAIVFGSGSVALLGDSILFEGYRNSTGGPITFLQSNDYAVTASTMVGLSANLGYMSYMNPVVFNGKIYTFESVGISIAALQGISSADSGNTWTNNCNLPNIPVSWVGLTSTPTKLIAFGTGFGTLNAQTVVASSTDGVNWTVNTTATVPTTYLIITSNETLIASLTGTSTYYTSTDYGVTWTSRTPTNVSNYGLYFNGSSSNVVIQLSVQGGGYSIDGGITWAASNMTSITGSFVAAAYGAGKGIVAVFKGSSSPYTTTVYEFSPDNGATWIQRAFPYAILPIGVVYVGNYFMVFMANGAYLYSTDAINWAPGTIATTQALAQNWSSFLGGSNLLAFNPLVGTVKQSSSCAIPDTTTYRLPTIAAPANGAKYVVKAQ